MTIYTGGCHCGNLAIEYKTALEPDNWPLRECQCSFCRKHAMLSTSDPNGEVLIVVRDPACLRRYRFATGVTDFLICANCGVYIGATVMNDGWVVLNARAMNCASDLVARPAQPRIFDQESADERIARRVRMWSRCRIEQATKR